MTDGGFSGRYVTAQDGLRLHVGEYGERPAPAWPVACLPVHARTTADFDQLAAALAGDPDRLAAPLGTAPGIEKPPAERTAGGLQINQP
jgi:hypothetical protein